MKFCDAVHGTISVLSRREWKALDILHALLMDFHFQGRVYYQNQWYTCLRLYEHADMVHTNAEDVKIMFWGGPPKAMKYYYGSVMDYMLDQCLHCLVCGDPDLLLFRFLEQTMEQVEYKLNKIKATAP